METSLRITSFRTYSITELCREFDCTARALRFYEEQGLLFPCRNQMQRVYSYKDRARLKLILRGRRVGLSLIQIRDLLETYEAQGEAAQNARALDMFKARLAVLEEERRQIDGAVEVLRSACQRLAAQGDITTAA
jgi:DNA-binding transcriptional MerR regulator